MGLYYQQTGDEMWKNQMRRLVDGFAKLMVYKDDYAYNPIFSTYPEASISPDSPILDPNCELEAGGTVSAGGSVSHSGISRHRLRTGP